MRTLQWALIAFVGAVSLGCSSAPDEESTPPSPALEGAYYSESGPLRWSSFKGNEYVTWSSDPACNDPKANAPETCAQHGTFALDAAHKTLAFTDSATGRVSTHTITIKETAARGALVGSTSPASVGLIEQRGQLTSPNVVSSFSLTNPSEPLVQEANLRTFAIACRVVGLLLNPPVQPVIVPIQPVISAPAPVRQQQCSS